MIKVHDKTPYMPPYGLTCKFNLAIAIWL
uniref:Uncharacterized protein n=1 Tax=Rhizophora mucronata TaxID=61149 RepID=A0A2P2NP91_RHIMU